jgi:valyl-tRNA synthetase
MRFGLLAQVTGTQAMRFDVQKIANARNFANKIKNAARFIQLNLDGFDAGQGITPCADDAVDKWILSRLAKLISAVDEAYANYEFADMTRELYAFFWNEFCDWYIEFSKSRLSGDAGEEQRRICQNNLVFILDASIKLLHPIMPFITEQIYAELPKSNNASEMLIGAEWPNKEDFEAFIDEEAEREITLVCAVAGAVRSAKSRYGISPKTSLDVVVSCANDLDAQAITSQADLVCSLVNIENLNVDVEANKPTSSTAAVLDGLTVYTIVEGYVDFEAERKRIEKTLAAEEKEVARLEKKLSNPGFLAKAAQEVIDKDTAKLEASKEKLEALKEQLSELS